MPTEHEEVVEEAKRLGLATEKKLSKEGWHVYRFYCEALEGRFVGYVMGTTHYKAAANATYFLRGYAGALTALDVL